MMGKFVSWCGAWLFFANAVVAQSGGSPLTKEELAAAEFVYKGARVAMSKAHFDKLFPRAIPVDSEKPDLIRFMIIGTGTRVYFEFSDERLIAIALVYDPAVIANSGGAEGFIAYVTPYFGRPTQHIRLIDEPESTFASWEFPRVSRRYVMKMNGRTNEVTVMMQDAKVYEGVMQKIIARKQRAPEQVREPVRATPDRFPVQDVTGQPWMNWHCAVGGFLVALPPGQQPGRVFKQNRERREDPRLGASFINLNLGAASGTVAYEVLDKPEDARKTLAKFQDELEKKKGVTPVVRIPRLFWSDYGLDSIYRLKPEGEPEVWHRHRLVVLGTRLFMISVYGPSRESVSTESAMRFIDSLSLGRDARAANHFPESTPQGWVWAQLMREDQLPGIRELREKIPENILRNMDWVNRMTAKTATIAQGGDPTFFAYSSEERHAQLMARIDELVRECEDPNTTPERRAAILIGFDRSAAALQGGMDGSNAIRASVIKSQNDFRDRQRYWEGVNARNAEAIRNESEAARIREEAWRSDADITHKRIFDNP
jgi:hypothetical protein